MMVAVEEWRDCQQCGDRLPLDVYHYAMTLIKRDGTPSYRKRCRLCNTRTALAHDQAMRNNPATREAYLAKRNATQRKWRAEHPERTDAYRERDRKRYRRRRKGINARRQARYAANPEVKRAKEREAYHRDIEASRAKNRESYRRVRNDPERWAEYLRKQRERRDANRDRVNENRRIWLRLRAEREGREVLDRYPIDDIKLDPLPIVAPLTATIAAAVERYGISAVEAMTRVDHRTLKLILANAADATVPFDAADRICLALGHNLFEFWPDDA